MKLLFSIGVVVVAVVLLAQSPGDVHALRKEIESLKAGQKALQKDMDEIKRMLGRPAAPQLPETPISIEDAPFAGDRNAKVTLIEFSDYQCGFCARHVTQTAPQIMADYVKTGKVKYVVRDFPLEGMHPAAAKAAEGAHCAGEQGKYWEMHQRLLTNQRSIEGKDLPAHARALNLDTGKFQQCLDSGKYAARVRKGQEEGQKAGVEGTPSFFLGLTPAAGSDIRAKKVLRGAYPYAAFKEAIESVLAAN